MSEVAEQEFRAYVAARQAALRRTAFLMCGDWHTADDLVQVTLTKLYVAWARVQRDRGPDAYAHRILANAVVDEHRRPWRREVLVEDPVERAVPGVGSDDRVDLQRALDTLTPGQRVTVVLRFWVDASVEETARALGCSPGTVKSQTARALASLRATLATADVLEEIP